MRRRRIAPEAHRSSRRLAHGNLKEISVNAHSFFCYRHNIILPLFRQYPSLNQPSILRICFVLWLFRSYKIPVIHYLYIYIKPYI